MGIAAGFGGIVLLISPTELSGLGDSVDLVGGLVVLLAALSWSAGSLYTRTADLSSSPLLNPAMEMLAGGVALGSWAWRPASWARSTWRKSRCSPGWGWAT